MTLTIPLPLGTGSLLLFLENAVDVAAVAVEDHLCLLVDVAVQPSFAATMALPQQEQDCRVEEHPEVLKPEAADKVQEHLAVQVVKAGAGEAVCKSLQFGIPMPPLYKKLPLPVWKAMKTMLEKKRGVSLAVAICCASREAVQRALAVLRR